MDVAALSSAIGTLGFPIVCVIAMAWFIWSMVKKTNEQNAKNMENLQNRCLAREDKLYEEIKENREINAKAIATITLYAEKLENIQHDVREIKEEINKMVAE